MALRKKQQRPGIQQSGCVVFFHLPKAGGSTISKLLRKQFPKSAIFHFGWDSMPDDWERITGLPEQEKSQLRLVDGHMPFGIHAHLPVKTRYFTILRNPVSRIVSMHRHLLAEERSPLHSQIQPGGAGLLRMFDQRLTTSLDNEQTRFLSGMPGALRVVTRERVIEPEIGFGDCTTEMLEQAKRNLAQHFDAVGILERFDETFALLKHCYGWPDWTYHRANTSQSARYRVTPELRKTILNANRLDAELHQFAQQLLDDAFAKHRSVRSVLRWHRFIQRARDRSDRFLRPAEKKLRSLFRRSKPDSSHAA